MLLLAHVETVKHRLACLRARHFLPYVFVHINKTGGSSVERALGLPFQHKTAAELLEEIGERRWATRYRFTIVRNPWDRAVSHYSYRVMTNQTGLGAHPTGFREWAWRVYGDRDPKYYDQPRMFMPQLDWLTDEGGRLLVEDVGRFETLEQDFRRICERIGRVATLPHLKGSKRRDYRLEFDDATAELVAGWFARDIEAFGYTF